MFLTNSPSIQEVLFFPQMRPEKTVTVALSEDEQTIYDVLLKEETMELNALKETSGLSNKKWDKAIKGLTSKKVTKVAKTDSILFVSIS
jgi:lysyl-tRNA synthetase class 2